MLKMDNAHGSRNLLRQGETARLPGSIISTIPTSVGGVLPPFAKPTAKLSNNRCGMTWPLIHPAKIDSYLPSLLSRFAPSPGTYSLRSPVLSALYPPVARMTASASTARSPPTDPSPDLHRAPFTRPVRASWSSSSTRVLVRIWTAEGGCAWMWSISVCMITPPMLAGFSPPARWVRGREWPPGRKEGKFVSRGFLLGICFGNSLVRH
jgi:hypothetical protein